MATFCMIPLAIFFFGVSPRFFICKTSEDVACLSVDFPCKLGPNMVELLNVGCTL